MPRRLDTGRGSLLQAHRSVDHVGGCVDLRGLREVEPGALLRWGLRGAVALGDRLVARVSAREC